MKKIYIGIMLFIFVCIISSCAWLDKDVIVPSYIHIPSYTFEAATDEGTSSHNIVDAWLFVNGNKVGAFELPATIPVIDSNYCDIIIYPGIKLNGTASTRAIYTFYTRTEVNAFLSPDSIITFTPNANYVKGITFNFIEDFESVGIVFEKTERSDTILHKTDDPNQVFEDNYSGYFALEGTRTYCELKTVTSYNLPKTAGKFSFLEINCKSNVDFIIGIIANEYNFSTIYPVVNITPSQNWKKIYINLTPTVFNNLHASSFDIFISAELPTGVQKAEVWLDNIKLINN